MNRVHSITLRAHSAPFDHNTMDRVHSATYRAHPAMYRVHSVAQECTGLLALPDEVLSLIVQEQLPVWRLVCKRLNSVASAQIYVLHAKECRLVDNSPEHPVPDFMLHLPSAFPVVRSLVFHLSSENDLVGSAVKDCLQRLAPLWPVSTIKLCHNSGPFTVCPHVLATIVASCSHLTALQIKLKGSDKNLALLGRLTNLARLNCHFDRPPNLDKWPTSLVNLEHAELSLAHGNIVASSPLFRSPQLHSLRLELFDINSSRAELHALEQLTALRRLSLITHSEANDASDALLDGIKHLTDLVELDLDLGSGVDGLNPSQAWLALASLPRLQDLNIKVNTLLWQPEAATVCLSQLSRLTLQEDNTIHEVGQLPPLPALQQLDVWLEQSSELQPANMAAMVQSMQRCPQLRSLLLALPFEDGVPPAVQAAVLELTQLKHLLLSCWSGCHGGHKELEKKLDMAGTSVWVLNLWDLCQKSAVWETNHARSPVVCGADDPKPHPFNHPFEL